MAAVRTLKLNLLADTKNFTRGLDHANAQSQTFSNKMGNALKSVAKSAALAGVAVAGAAVAFGVDAVKAAIEDEKSQTRLAKALKNVTGATKSQVSQVEDLITKMQFQYGIADSKLRPAYQRLITSTKDYTKTEQLLQLALDVSAGTGKDVETVANALGKAYDGNTTALKRLGVPLDANKLKTEGMKYATEQLAKVYAGQAQASADTFEGKMRILNERFGEFKESVGQKLMPVLMRAMDYFQQTVIPTLEQVGAGFSGKETSVSNKVRSLAKALGEPVANTPGYNVGAALKQVADAFIEMIDAFSTKPGDVSDTESALQRLADALTSIANAFEKIGKAWSKARQAFEFLATNKFAKWTPIGIGAQVNKFFIDKLSGKALGGPVMRGTSYLVGEHGPEIFTPSASGNITPNGRINGGTTIINLNGIVDAESARRSIEALLKQSSLRTGAVNFVGGAL